MTVDEIIEELQKLSNEGKGNYKIVDGEYGGDVDLCIYDEGKIVYL